MLRIDGSHGEGGGQVVRSSLALSMVSGLPFRIERIRAGRKQPGLMRQHLTAVRAAQSICQAEVVGAAIGATEMTFKPGRVRPGEYTFSVGTAGSTTLVLQAVLPALLTAPGPSRLVLEGGTHNPMAPPFDFLARAYLPLVSRMGPRVTAKLERYGFYPAGGGRFLVDIETVPRLRGFDLHERGAAKGLRAVALVARLPAQIARRELEVVRRRLNWPDGSYKLIEIEDSPGPGNVLMLEVESDNVTEVFTSFGEVRRPAESVAKHAVREYERYRKTEAAAGEFLTDQLLLPLAVAGGGSFSSTGLSRHATTHIDLIGKFLDLGVRIESAGGAKLVHVES